MIKASGKRMKRRRIVRKTRFKLQKRTRIRRRRSKTGSRRRLRLARPKLSRAYLLGETTAKEMQLKSSISPAQLLDLNKRWAHWLRAQRRRHMPWRTYFQINQQFFKGLERRSGVRNSQRYVLLPTDKTVSVIITAMNEAQTIPKVLDQLGRLPVHEKIIVINGSTDDTFALARRHSDAVILHYDTALGHDVGRALGAKVAKSDILVFIDGDIPIKAEQLVPFIGAVDQGLDIALNKITPYLPKFSYRDAVTVVKELLNRTLGRSDLGADSLTAIPHALSRHAVETIGYEALAVPPKAQAAAVLAGLKIGSATSVNVVAANRMRGTNVGSSNQVAHLIIGDHIEAFHFILNQTGSRHTFADLIRTRHLEGQ